MKMILKQFKTFMIVHKLKVHYQYYYHLIRGSIHSSVKSSYMTVNLVS